MKPVPQLAEGYEVSKDGLTYTFRLRKGVKFHDGTEFTADAVKMNFDRGMNPESKLTRRTFFKFVDRVEVVDPYTVRIVLKTPTAGFIQRLANGTAGMICPSLLKRATTKQVTAYEACGTGPYTLKRFSPAEELYAVKFPNYRVPGLPKFDAIRWVPVTENSTRAMMLPIRLNRWWAP
ncbi:ABC transporter substrate-binding protein [Sutterella seckii]|uniref:ABC transporter substrate-binding protein n=1 Tax=Sutterella seckii TaxID=1944635 RepID=UPI0021F80BF5|nr:ABC transporter substrate-binding protein [Sutterella seckii]